jgi:Sulfatase
MRKAATAAVTAACFFVVTSFAALTASAFEGVWKVKDTAGQPSTFGGVIPTPALDRIAANGLRYTNFHSTALCSPTAALITGRNHHSVVSLPKTHR